MLLWTGLGHRGGLWLGNPDLLIQRWVLWVTPSLTFGPYGTLPTAASLSEEMSEEGRVKRRLAELPCLASPAHLADGAGTNYPPSR